MPSLVTIVKIIMYIISYLLVNALWLIHIRSFKVLVSERFVICEATTEWEMVLYKRSHMTSHESLTVSTTDLYSFYHMH